MPRQLWLADVLADEFRGVKGFRVETYSGWRTRGRIEFDPEGVMDHHTGGGGYDALLNYMANGSSISPLCNIATSRPSSGVVRITVVTAGRANHAGVGELPWRRGQGSTGNRRTIGIENQNTGGQSWPSQQVEAIRRCDAALLRHMGRDEGRHIDHKTYARPPGRKVDRYAVSPATEKQEIAKLLAGSGRTPAPSATGDTDMFIRVDKQSVFMLEASGRKHVPDGALMEFRFGDRWFSDALASGAMVDVSANDPVLRLFPPINPHIMFRQSGGATTYVTEIVLPLGTLAKRHIDRDEYDLRGGNPRRLAVPSSHWLLGLPDVDYAAPSFPEGEGGGLTKAEADDLYAPKGSTGSGGLTKPEADALYAAKGATVTLSGKLP